MAGINGIADYKILKKINKKLTDTIRERRDR